MPNPKSPRVSRGRRDWRDVGDVHAERLEHLGAAPDVVEAGRADPAGVGLSDVSMRNELRSIESELGLAEISPEAEQMILERLQGSVDDVIAWVAGDIELAAAVARVERTRENPRVTLLRTLDRIVPGPT